MNNKKNNSAICIFHALDDNNNGAILSLYFSYFSSTNRIITISNTFIYHDKKTILQKDSKEERK